MKKRIMALLMAMAMVMVLGIGMVSHAEGNDWNGEDWDGRYFSGDYSVDFIVEGMFSYNYSGDITLRYENRSVAGSIITDRGDNISWVATEPTFYSNSLFSPLGDTIVFENIIIHVNGDTFNSTGMEIRNAGTIGSLEDMFCELKFSSFFGDGDYFVSIGMSLSESNAPTEPTIHEISTPFTGTAVSDRGEYTLALAGYFEKELADGTHELTLEEIKEQTISVVAYNKANGVKRVMTQSTIEEMSVTVSGGVVTEYTIRGRVQTTGGKLDRYTAVISN